MLCAPTPILQGHFAPIASGPRGTVQTIRHMRAAVEDAKHDLDLLNHAVTIIYLTPPRIDRIEVDALLNWARQNIRYVKDINGIETLSTPQVTRSRRAGDCDDMSTLLAALCELVGYPTRFICASYSPSEEMEHVYVQILIDGMWVDADPTENYPLGFAPEGATAFLIEEV